MTTRYPDIEHSDRHSILPQPVQIGLKQLASDLQRGRVDGRNLSTVLDGLASLALSDIVRISSEIRHRLGLSYWYRPEQVSFLGRLMGRSPYVQLKRTPGIKYIFLCHGDGYVREAALHRLEDAAPSAFILCLMALQLNDWVPQVRLAARDAFGRILTRTEPRVVADAAMFLLERRRVWRRGQEEVAVLDALLWRRDVRAEVIDRLRSRRDGTPHRVLISALADDHLDDALHDLMRDAVHPAVRALAAATLLRQEARWPVGYHKAWVDKSMGIERKVTTYATRPVIPIEPVEGLLAAAAADASAQVRRVAMQAIIDSPDLWPQRQTLIGQLATDNSLAIRAGMDYVLRQQAKEIR